MEAPGHFMFFKVIHIDFYLFSHYLLSFYTLEYMYVYVHVYVCMCACVILSQLF